MGMVSYFTGGGCQVLCALVSLRILYSALNQERNNKMFYTRCKNVIAYCVSTNNKHIHHKYQPIYNYTQKI